MNAFDDYVLSISLDEGDDHGRPHVRKFFKCGRSRTKTHNEHRYFRQQQNMNVLDK